MNPAIQNIRQERGGPRRFGHKAATDLSEIIEGDRKARQSDSRVIMRSRLMGGTKRVFRKLNHARNLEYRPLIFRNL